MADNAEENVNYNNFMQDLWKAGILTDPKIIYCLSAYASSLGANREYTGSSYSSKLGSNAFYWTLGGYGALYDEPHQSAGGTVVLQNETFRSKPPVRASIDG